MKHFIDFGNSQTEVVTEMHVNWADVISHFEDLYSNIKAGGPLVLKKGESSKKISISKKNEENLGISGD
jgi:hypothetical protein